MRHTTKLCVRGYHLDVYGHVNNARYLEFLEEARWRFFEEQDVIEAITGEALAMVVVNININYRRAALIHEELEIATEVTRVGNKSFVIHQEIAVAETGEMIADTDGTYVLFDNAIGTSVVIEGKYKELLDRLR
ncbi:thioesterase family protein [Litoribacillus peritrichatus]|uniref:Long-chain acyl-CoA thioesterase FadM n=1 Tax=Litoribacillus peritrichatus TaxID=718191 RepID=A0ABP7NCN5_9GAMM